MGKFQAIYSASLAVSCTRFMNTVLIFLLTGGWQVSGVAFDSYWSPPNSDGTGESVMYRFGSVGQVLWYSIDKYV